MSQSLFDYINDHLDQNGNLPQDFHLPVVEDENKVKFADGALDGISIYHMGYSPLSEDDAKKLELLIRMAASGKKDEAEDGFAEFCKKHFAIKIIDGIQSFIMDHKDELSPNEMHHFAVSMMLESADRNCVKVGMSILELFNTYADEKLAKAIRIIGLSDEFTIFSVFLMRRWPNGQMEILELAKKVRGWGRIHCVDFIEPENDEIRKWLLLNGVDNDVVPAYSAWKVFEKADIASLIEKDDLTPEEMNGILKVMDAMLDEGPVTGISNLDDQEAFLKKVIGKAESGYKLSDKDREVLENIRAWKVDKE